MIYIWRRIVCSCARFGPIPGGTSDTFRAQAGQSRLRNASLAAGRGPSSVGKSASPEAVNKSCARQDRQSLFCELVGSILAGTGGFPAHEKNILYTNLVQFIKEILATSVLGNEFGLTHK